MGSIVSNRILFSGYEGGMDKKSEDRLFALLSLVARPKKGENVPIKIHAKDILPPADKLYQLWSEPHLMLIGLAVMSPDGRRVLQEMASHENKKTRRPLQSSILTHCDFRSVLKAAALSSESKSLMHDAEMRFPGCLEAGEQMLEAWALCKETDPLLWGATVGSACLFDGDAYLTRHHDGSLSLSFESENEAAYLIFRSLCSKIPDATILAWAVDEDSDYAYQAVTDERGELCEMITHDEENCRFVHQWVHGVGSVPYRYAEPEGPA